MSLTHALYDADPQTRESAVQVDLAFRESVKKEQSTQCLEVPTAKPATAEKSTMAGVDVTQRSVLVQTDRTITAQRSRGVSPMPAPVIPTIAITEPVKPDAAPGIGGEDHNESMKSLAESQPESQPGIVALSDVQAESQRMRTYGGDEDEIDELWESQSQS